MFQVYENHSNNAIEAKYVFPLGDLAVVVGFEAYINGKHIVGEVKEKEKAHKEYKEAISQGHGAYLMDQDEETPVSVGLAKYYLQLKIIRTLTPVILKTMRMRTMKVKTNNDMIQCMLCLGVV